ncbi:MAG: MATE family efflux transporter [Clostridia bacterium]|nr:MATE family efflux transporter [Clostridia bacterium]
MNVQLSDHFSYGKLIKFTLPSIAMMIFSSIYGIVDGYFVSNFAGSTPFAAVNFIFPFIMIISTVGFMFGTGGTAIVAKTLGENDREKANEYFSLFTYISFGLGAVFSILAIIFIRPIATFLGASGALLENAVIYATILLIVMPFFILQLLFQSFFVTAEKPQLGFIVIVIAGISNIILDAVLVTLLPYEYKLIGAAVATAVSQLLGGGLPLIYFFSKNSSLLRLGKTKFYFKATIKALVNGSSEFMSNVSMSLVGMLFNIQLLKYAGENGVSAYGVMMYVSMVFNSAFIGYSIGTAPIIGYNFGAKNNKELKNVLRKSIVFTIIVGLAMVVFAELLNVPLSKIFVGYNKELLDLTVSGFKIFALCFLFMGFAIFGSGFFTALSDGLTSAIISFLRTMVFEVLAVLLLPLLIGIDGIWYSVVIAELMACVLSILFIIIKKKMYNY